MAYFALYPFGVRPHMPMARYLYRHWPGAVYSLEIGINGTESGVDDPDQQFYENYGCG